MENVTVDWKGHRSEGYATAAYLKTGSWEAAKFGAPLISHIKDNLYVGGCVGGLELDDDFVEVVSLYHWEKYTIGPNTQRHEVEMYDSHDGASMIDVRIMAQYAIDGMKKGKTLIHCQAGLNRSNLVAAVVLREVYGMSSREAIDLLRERRDQLVLCNETFENQLLALDN